ncbi:hypothetical protein ACH5BF_02225 [Arcobacter sp. YIC-464]|uniref:hypothetical protein n=1 Tax=Arcobacter sp. YIC-464 TaxID=3376631 RepID=UPI003C23C180
MYKTILIATLSTIFIGCTSTNALKYFDADKQKARAVQHTKKADIIENNEQKVLFWATYLNNIKELDKETFIISTYFINQKIQDFSDYDYKIVLNENINPISFEEIKEDSKYNNILKNRSWGKHYLVKFETLKKETNLTIELQNKNAKASLKFEK